MRIPAVSRIALFCLGFLIATNESFCAEPKPPSEAILLNNKAFALEKTGKTNEAIELMRDIIRRYPGYSMGRENLAIFLNNKALECGKQGRSEEALHFLEESLFYCDNQSTRDNLNALLKWMDIDPTDRDQRIKLSKDCIKRGDRKSAIVHLRAAQAIRSEASTAGELTKLEKEEAKSPTEARADSPASPMTAYKEEVMVRMNSSYFPMPSRDGFQIEVSFQINPNGSHTHPVLEKSSGLKAKDDEALKAISMAAPFRPLPEGEKEPLLVEYSFTYKVGKEADKNSSLAANRKAIGLLMEAQNLAKEGHLQDATEKYRQARNCAVKRFIPLIDAHIVDTLVADAESRQKTDPALSEALLREALLAEPGMELAKKRLDKLLMSRGVTPADINSRIKLAEEFEEKKESGPALVEYTRALELLDRPGPSLLPLAVDRLRGRVAEAIERLRQGRTREEDNWRKFLATSPNSLEALMALARIVESRDRKEAIELLSRAQKLQPGNQAVEKELERLQGSELQNSSEKDSSQKSSGQ